MKAGKIFLDRDNRKHLSIASIWEIAIKISIGKLKLEGSAEHLLLTEARQNGIRFMDIRFDHALRVATLPYHHRDPVDRLIIAQAQIESFPVLSNDEAFDAYGIQRLW